MSERVEWWGMWCVLASVVLLTAVRRDVKSENVDPQAELYVLDDHRSGCAECEPGGER